MNDELFKTLLRRLPQPFFLFLTALQKGEKKKNKYAQPLIQVGVKHPSKNDDEGMFGDKRRLNVLSCSGFVVMTSHSLLWVNEAVFFFSPRQTKESIPPQHLSPALLSRPPSLLRLSLPSSTSLLLSHCLPFKGEGSHLFLGYLPVAVMAACLIITGSSLAYFCFLQAGIIVSMCHCLISLYFKHKHCCASSYCCVTLGYI